MMAKKEKSLIIVRKTPRGLQPVSSFDAELLLAAPLGTEFNLASLTKRSLPQHRTYWKALSEVVKATGKWPTAEKLHDALKRACGYVQIRYNLDGSSYIATDSTSFEAMNHDEFCKYMELAMAKLSEAIGYDPLAFLEDAA